MTANAETTPNNQTRYTVPLGTVGILSVRDIDQGQALVGYWLDKSYSNQGIMTAVTKQMIQNAKELRINTLILHCNPSNIGSQRIAQKCGFTYTNTLKKAENLYGEWCDLDVYQLGIY